MTGLTACRDCQQITSGDCGKHQLAINVSMPRPYQCPVCFGTGRVPNGFYSRVGTITWVAGSLEPENCRSCKASGVVWSP